MTRTNQEPLGGVLLVTADRPLASAAAQASADCGPLVTARDPHQALRSARQQQPAAVIVDLDLLPNGPADLIGTLRETAPAAVIVATSGGDAPRAEVAAYRAGCELFVPKPVNADYLREIVRAARTRTHTAGWQAARAAKPSEQPPASPAAR